MNPLERRIIEISYSHKLSHIGSCLTAVGIIDKIFKEKLPRDKFVLSCGHAGLALYVVLEQYGFNAEDLFTRCGVHPDRLKAPEAIDCSTGSLGQGLPIALGMALADRARTIYCLISDGEAAEGSIYEALNIKRKYKVDNLKVYMNYNGWGAYDEIRGSFDLPGVTVVNTSEHWFMKDWKQEAHYRVLTDKDYELINKDYGT